MYNRYIPQSDGSYQRNRMQDSPPQKPTKPQTPPPPPPQPECSPPPVHVPKPQPVGIGNFFKQLLPPNLDTADLLIILLLLLMAGDNPDERSNALLTMALYFFM